jgi:class 3 adenylate cyclase
MRARRGSAESHVAARPVEERRQVTVLFCDLVGFSGLAAQLDPEDLRDALRAYQACCVACIEARGGYVAQYLGDGVVAYFGHPVASEDAPAQAIRAGQEIVRRTPELQTPAGPLQARAGLATGLAVVGDILGTGPAEQAAITGRVAVLASRIQAAAPPGAVVAPDSLRQLLGDVFDCADLGPHTLKGVEETVRLWAIGPERQHDSRFDATHGGRHRDVIGRNAELQVLRDAWREAAGGARQAVLLSGEAGIGKSALLAALRSEVAASGGGVAIFQCSPWRADTPLYPVLAYLQRQAGWLEQDQPDARVDKLHSLLQAFGLGEEAAVLAAHLAANDEPGLQPPQAAQRRKQETIRLLDRLIARAAIRAPLLYVLEDAHWADPTSLELLEHVIADTGRRIMVVVAARPEYAPAWAADPDHRVVRLRRLGADDAQALVEQATAGRLPPASVTDILRRGDGVPLYLKELAHAGLEGAAHSGGAAPVIPMTLQDGLMARLDRLGSAKLAAQVAAVLGRTFTLTLLAQVFGRPASQIAADLERLQSARIIRGRQGAPGEYVFSHALVQQAAYDSLLREPRRRLHRRCAEAILRLQPQAASNEPEILAHHCFEGGETLEAARHWLRAGQRAQLSAANAEAAAHFRRGLDALGRSGLAAAEAELEFHLQLGLGQAAYVLLGPAHAETVAAYTRAQALVEAAPDPGQRARALYGIFSGYHFASRLDLAEAPAQRMLALAREENRQGDLCQAHRMLGYIAFFRGRHAEAIEHFEALAQAYRPEDHGAAAYAYGADCLVGARGFQAVIESVRGAYAPAAERAKQNLAFAESLGHPASIGWAYAAAAYVGYFGDDPHATLALAEAGADYCRSYDVASWGAHCRLFRAWAAARLGRPGDHAREVRELTALAASGNRLGICIFQLVLAELLLLQGDEQAALAQADDAVREAAETGQQFFEPAVLLMRARCLAASGDAGRARRAFKTAAAAARRATAQTMMLRAVGGLAALGARRPEDLGRGAAERAGAIDSAG